MGWLQSSTKGVIGGATSCGGVLLGGAKAAGALLTFSGFTSTGPAAGSCAAAWMSSVATVSGGAVPAGSLYASVQSLAMGGALGATSAVGGGLLVGGALGGAIYFAGQKIYKTFSEANSEEAKANSEEANSEEAKANSEEANSDS